LARVTIHGHEIRGRLLPPVCICCGDRATMLVRKRFQWCPGWALLCVPVSVLLLAIHSREATIEVPTCDRHPDPWRGVDRFRKYLYVAFFGGLAAILVFVGILTNLGRSDLVLSVFGFFTLSWVCAVVGLIIAYVVFNLLSIRASWISRDAITLSCVSKRFAEAVEREREQPTSGSWWRKPTIRGFTKPDDDRIQAN
jgi:hypothetical protein